MYFSSFIEHIADIFVFLFFIIESVFFFNIKQERIDSARHQNNIKIAAEKKSNANYSTEKLVQESNLSYIDEENAAYWLSILAEFKYKNLTELEKRITVEGNSNLSYAQIILLGEQHNLRNVQIINWQIINQLAKPGDILLRETDQKEVDLLEAILNDVSLSKAETQWAIAKSEKLNQTGAFPLEGVIGLGWDLAASNLDRTGTTAMAIRNAGLAQLIDKLQCRRIFVMAGLAHLPTSINQKSIKYKETFAALNDVLQNKSYALVIPVHLHDVAPSQIRQDSSFERKLLASILNLCKIYAVAYGTTKGVFALTVIFDTYNSAFVEISETDISNWGYRKIVDDFQINLLALSVIAGAKALGILSRQNTKYALPVGVIFLVGLCFLDRVYQDAPIDLSHTDYLCDN